MRRGPCIRCGTETMSEKGGSVYFGRTVYYRDGDRYVVLGLICKRCFRTVLGPFNGPYLDPNTIRKAIEDQIRAIEPADLTEAVDLTREGDSLVELGAGDPTEEEED